MSCINVAKFVLINQLEKDLSMIETCRLKNVLNFIQTTLSFVLPWKIINMYYDMAQKYWNVTVKYIAKHEKLEYKKNKLNIGMTFSTVANNLVCIRSSLSLNSRLFLINTLHQFLKDYFVAPSTSIIKNSNIFQKNSVYPETFYVHNFLLLTSTYLPNL